MLIVSALSRARHTPSRPPPPASGFNTRTRQKMHLLPRAHIVEICALHYSDSVASTVQCYDVRLCTFITFHRHRLGGPAVAAALLVMVDHARAATLLALLQPDLSRGGMFDFVLLRSTRLHSRQITRYTRRVGRRTVAAF